MADTHFLDPCPPVTYHSTLCLSLSTSLASRPGTTAARGCWHRPGQRKVKAEPLLQLLTRYCLPSSVFLSHPVASWFHPCHLSSADPVRPGRLAQPKPSTPGYCTPDVSGLENRFGECHFRTVVCGRGGSRGRDGLAAVG